MSQMTLAAFLGGLLELDRHSWLLLLPFPLCPGRNTDAMLVTLETEATMKDGGARREKILTFRKLHTSGSKSGLNNGNTELL